LAGIIFSACVATDADFNRDGFRVSCRSLWVWIREFESAEVGEDHLFNDVGGGGCAFLGPRFAVRVAAGHSLGYVDEVKTQARRKVL
jgi:hypothetical protein